MMLLLRFNIVDSMVIKRPSSSSSSKSKHNQKKQNLCLYKAYHSKEIEQEIVKRRYIPHMRHRREEKESEQEISCKKMGCRIELIHGITDSGNYLQIRYEKKKDENYILALVQLANSLIVYRRIILG